jgi:hypothetical protein
MITTAHTAKSSYREMLLEYLFVGELLRHLWKRGIYSVEVLKPQTDDAGYDLVVECNSVIRHIQLKASHLDASTARVNINKRLAEKPGGCVIWIWFNSDTLELDSFLWFGGPPGKSLPDISELKVARHTRRDAQGRKGERSNVRVLPKRRFERLESVCCLIERLFGLPEVPCHP